jgi:hypothetical protein
MNSTEKSIFIILAISFLFASAYITGAGSAGVMAQAGDNRIVKVVPVISWSEPGMPVGSSGLALPYGVYAQRDYDFGPFQSGNLNSICSVPTYYYSGQIFCESCGLRSY